MSKKEKKNEKQEQVINEQVVQQSMIEIEIQPDISFRSEIIRGIIPFLKYSEAMSLRLINQRLNQLIMNELTILKSACQRTTQQQLDILLSKFSSIQHIIFPHLFENELSITIHNKEQIKTMIFKYTQFQEQYLNGFISEFPRLKHLGVMQDAFLNLLKPSQALENIDSLDAHHIFQIQPRIFDLFPNLRKLKLSINSYNIFFSTLHTVKQYPNLRVLSIRLWGNKLKENEFTSFIEFINKQKLLQTVEIRLNLYKLGIQRSTIIKNILSLPNINELILYGLTIQEINSLQFTKLYQKIVIGQCTTRSNKQLDEDQEQEQQDSQQLQQMENEDNLQNQEDQYILTTTLQNISQFTKELDLTNLEQYFMLPTKEQANKQCRVRIPQSNVTRYVAPLQNCIISDKFELQFY